MGESRAILSLAAILSFRMLGLFMIYPVFAIYAPQFHHATTTLIGIALGIYGLTQALFQLPLSMLSDRIGRKPVIIGGLFIFALGSIIAASSHNIFLLIIGRALQGAGAIGSTIMAYAADLTTIENRTKAMAILGMTIGVSFAIAIILGPILNSWVHLTGIFWLTAIFACLGIYIQHFIPATKKLLTVSSQNTRIIKGLIKKLPLLKLNLSVLILHALLTASFVAVPVLLMQHEISSNQQWKIYLPVLLSAFLLSLPLLILAEKKFLIKHTLSFGICVIAIAECLLYYYPNSYHSLLVGLLLFFTGFTLLEALLPSLVSKIAPINHKGSAMGIYSTFQFFGIFMGGFIGGLLRTHYDISFIFYCATSICIIWLILIAFTSAPPLYKSQIVKLKNKLFKQGAHNLAEHLLNIPGVMDVMLSVEDGVAYLKVDNKMFDESSLIHFKE